MTPQTNVDYSQLNEQQLAAVLQTHGPMVIYAGAGSGKTKTICHKIAHLLDSSVYGFQILAVTFTNKAAKEMKNRIEELVGKKKSASILVSTFHSACARILRTFCTEIGFTENFSVYDDSDQKNLLKSILAELNVPEKILPINSVKSKIDKWKNEGQTPELVLKRMSETGTYKAPKSVASFQADADEELIYKIYEQYQARLKKVDSMDFNDLILNTVMLLEFHPNVLNKLQDRFQFLLIDEFQDTNPVQFQFIQLLASKNKNLCIVGDDDQSIYSWRGAEPTFILNFAKFYPDAKTYKLEQNYRSSKLIVESAASLIGCNKFRAPKTLWSNIESSSQIKLKKTIHAYEESRFVVSEIKRRKNDGQGYLGQAVLYRTNAQTRTLEDELRKNMIPYVIYGSVRFYDRAEIKLIQSYLKLLVNPNDFASFEKAINSPRRGLGPKTLTSILEYWQESEPQATLFGVIQKLCNGQCKITINRGLTSLKQFSETYIKLADRLKECSNLEVVFQLLLKEVSIEEFLRNQYPEDFEERRLNVLEFGKALKDFTNNDDLEFTENESDLSAKKTLTGPALLTAFLNEVALASEPTAHNVEQGINDAVTLMTIHSSKGLEFDTVYITGLEEGILPHYNSLDRPESVEEERRLLYVAMTRARQNLTLSYCRTHRFRPDMWVEPSRFLDDIPAENLSLVSEQFSGEESTRSSQHNIFLKRSFGSSKEKQISEISNSASTNEIRYEPFDSDSPWKTGTKVVHKVFGVGTVKGCEKSLQGYKLDVYFPTAGQKKILESYLQIEEYF